MPIAGLTLAAALVLADGSLVTLALAELVHDLHTTVQGVAAVLAVFVAVLAVALVPAGRAARPASAGRLGAAGFAAMAAASVLCAAAGSLGLLLAGRVLQAAGGAAGLASAFILLDGAGAGRRRWIAAAVIGAAAGPALGGLLTQAFSWRAIFVAQVPLALGGALACWRVGIDGIGAAVVPEVAAAKPGRREVRGFVALALVSAALLAVLFLLVLLLVAGWAVSPLGAAALVTVLPLAALLGARYRAGDPRVRAAIGCALVAAGVGALAWLPGARLAWTIPPQLLAGVGMGLALPALGGELLPERSARDAMLTLSVRHAGMALVLIALAPVIAHQLGRSTELARERGIALVLDARLAPLDKLRLAPALLSAVQSRSPRTGLQQAIAANRASFSGGEEVVYDALARRADDTLVAAVLDAFRLAFLLGGALALLAAVLVVPVPALGTAPVAAALVLVLAVPGAYAVAASGLGPTPVPIRDPCQPRALPGTGGLGGLLQDRVLATLDASACRVHATREELVLALASSSDAAAFKRRHGVDPRSLSGLLGLLLRGG